MAMLSHRLRRALLTTTSSFNRSISLSPCSVTPAADFPSVSALQRSFLGSPSPTEVARAPVRLFSSTRQYKLYKEGDEITEDTVLFEGCDYNHWLITMDFPKDNPLSPNEMVTTYEQTCATGLGISLEEAKKKMYACSTTTYQGFQAIMTEEESEKFKDLPGVVFVLPDSYIDPQNKEYGGDKYENGVITHRPPPIHNNRTRSRGERNNPRFDRQGGGGYGQQPPMQGGGGNYGPPHGNGTPGYGTRAPPPFQGGYNQGPGSPPPPYQAGYNQGPGSSPPPYQAGYNQGPGSSPPPYQAGYNQGPGSLPPPYQTGYNQVPGSPPPPYQAGYNQGQGSPVPPHQGTQGSYGQAGSGNYSQGPQGGYNQGGYNQGGPRNYSPQGNGNYGPAPGAGQEQNQRNAEGDWNNNNPASQPGSDQGRRY